MKFKRRLHQLLLLALMTAASSAMTATLFSEAWKDLTKYFNAAASLVLQAAIGVDNTRFDTLPPAQRISARTELQKLKDQLELLFIEQTTLVSQFEFFVKIARDPSRTPAQRKNYWDNNVLPRISTVAEAVSQVRTFSEKGGQPFSVALSTDERLALGDTLAARSAALKTFESMAPPASADELLQFEGLINDYNVLRQNLFKLRRAIFEALGRLASA